MRRRNSGFSILELVIALAIAALVLTAATTFFIGSVRQYKIQTKIVETNTEGILGLELFRQDLESIGFGVPWGNVSVTQDKSAPPFHTFSGGPMVVVSQNNPSTGTVNSSDYLVIRSTRVGTGRAAGKWTTLQAGGGMRSWGSPEDDLAAGDRVIVLAPTLNQQTLVTPGTGVSFSAAALLPYAPADNLTVTNIVYGVANTDLTFPWNRADYYIDTSSLPVPQRCAPNTGVLVKRVVRQVGGDLETPPLPLLDCAAAMEVIYGLDTDGNPATNLAWDDDISGLTADAIRTQLKEVRVYILAQEGQRDDSYRTPSDNITVGPSVSLGSNSDVSGYRNYRWKVYTIVVKPRNLGN